MKAYNSIEIKTEIQSVSNARESIENSKDISGSMVKLGEAMNNLKPLLSKQSDYLSNFVQSQGTSSGSSQDSEIRRYSNKIYDIAITEIHQFLHQADQYFSLDQKNSWKKIANQIQKELLQEKEKLSGTSPNQIIEFIFKVINVKDRLLRDFLRSIIYRKILLFKDLSIEDKGFVHLEKKLINKSIEDCQLNKDFVSPLPFFEQIQLSKEGKEGIWNLATLENTLTPIPEFLKLLNFELEEMFMIVRNYSNLNEEQINKEEIRRNDKQVESLRGKIDQQIKEYQILERKYRDSISKDDKMDVVELKERLKDAEETIESKELEIKQLKYEFRDSSSQIKALKEKVAELTSDLEKLTKEELTKLKDLEGIQKTLNTEFNKVYKAIMSFGNIFEFENDGKRSLANEIVQKKQAIEKMAMMLCRQKNKNKDLQSQINRLNELILELGARIKLKRAEERGSLN